MAGLKFGMKIDKKIKEARKQITMKRKKNLQAATMEWHGGVVNQLSGNRSGRQYRIPGASKTYTASAPGQAPAQRTGALRSSYRFRVAGNDRNPVGEVGTPYEYGLFLEKGTRNMAPRPHVQPAFDQRKAAIMAKLRKRWDS